MWLNHAYQGAANHRYNIMKNYLRPASIKVKGKVCTLGKGSSFSPLLHVTPESVTTIALCFPGSADNCLMMMPVHTVTSGHLQTQVLCHIQLGRTNWMKLANFVTNHTILDVRHTDNAAWCLGPWARSW